LQKEVVTLHGVRGDFEAFIAAAREVDASRVRTFHGDASLAHHNVSAGLKAVVAERAAIGATGFRVDWDGLTELPRIALGLVYAVERVGGQQGGDAALQKLLARARILRDIGVAAATALSKSGDVPAAEVKKLKVGAGPRNLARALVRLAEFFTTFRAEAHGRSTFGDAEVAEAERISSELLRRVKPAGVRRTPGESLTAAQRDRDAFAALLEARYELLERAAGARWGRSLGKHVPSLYARVAAGAKKPAKGTKKKGAKKDAPVTAPVSNAPETNKPVTG
jgi:hypothetical protein